MKKIIVFLSLITLVISLAACEDPIPEVELDYTDFEEHLVTSYEEVETIEDERYVVYYYGKSCSICTMVKQDVLEFFSTFTLLPFYILEVYDAPDSTSFEDNKYVPAIYVIANGEVLDEYVGKTEIFDFIRNYQSIDSIPLDYSHFSSQHLLDYQSALEIESDAYLIYYYLEDCPHCIAAKDDFLKWAFQRDIDEIYFMNGAIVSGSGTLPTELFILNSGTPILAVMTNGEFADEYYSGTDPVLNYIAELGMGEITTDQHIE